MSFKKIAGFIVTTGFVVLCVTACFAQDATSQPPAAAQPTPDAQQQEEKLKLERKATALLEQVVGEAQSLKLPDNRIRVQINAADMFWDRNSGRARGLFTDAGVGLAQMTVDVDRADREDVQNLSRLRRELVLTAARHDAELGYQLLRSTQPPTSTGNEGNGRRFIVDPQTNLEQNLLAAIAATDPKVAYQKASESLDKGEYPTALARVLAQLQTKDQEAFTKLSDKALSKLNPNSILTNRDATTLTMGLLSPGPRLADTSTKTVDTATTASGNRILSESAYHDLLDNAITAALSVTSLGAGNNNFRGGGRGGFRMQQPNPQTQPDDAQVQQNNARMLLFSLQTMLSQIDQYLPERSQAVRQKLTELGINNNQVAAIGQMRTLMQQGTSDALVAAANVAPPQMQTRLYQQAAQKAIDEGNADRATQIANDHLDESGRNTIMQAIDFKRTATTASAEKLDEIKQKLARLPSDSDRVKFLIELSDATQKDNPKLALRFLDDARNLVNRKATSYKDFDDQLKVAHAFARLDPKRSFEVLEPGIAQLNELLAAAQVLNGFEVQVFIEGEMPLQGGSDLGGMIGHFGQELASLSKLDFERARATADKFQFAEPRLMSKLAIVQTVLGVQQVVIDNGFRNQNFRVFTR